MNAIEKIKSQSERDINVGENHVRQIEHYLLQCLFPADFVLDIIEGKTGSYSLRYQVRVPQTNSTLLCVNQVVTSGVAYFILHELQRILSMPTPETIDNMGSVSIARRASNGSESLVIVSPKYRMSYTKDAGVNKSSAYVRVDTQALDDENDLDAFQEAMIELDAVSTVEDGGVLVYKMSTDYHDEVVRLESRCSLKTTFKEELQRRYDENIAAL